MLHVRIQKPVRSSSAVDVDYRRHYDYDDDGPEYEDEDDEEGAAHTDDPLAAVPELGSLPLKEALARAAPLLGQEDTRMPAAFALLERLKVCLCVCCAARCVCVCV